MNKKIKKRQPACIVIREKLKAEILAGQHQELSESRLIQRFQVSSVTARRVLNDLAGDGLLSRQVGRGSIVVRPADRAFKEFGLIFFDMFDLKNFFIAEIVRGIENHARDQEHHLHIFTTRGRHIDGQGQSSLSCLVKRRKLDGVFILSPLAAESVAFFQRESMPCVTVSNRYPALGISSVMFDHEAAVRAVCRALADAGRRRIALINMRAEQTDVERSRDIIRRAWRVIGGKADPATYREELNKPADAERAMRYFYRLPPARRPDALIVAGGNLSPAVESFLAQCPDWRPRTVHFAERSDQYADTIVPDYYQLGQAAYELMAQRIRQPAAQPVDVLLPFAINMDD